MIVKIVHLITDQENNTQHMHGSYYILCLCYMCSQQPALNNNACIHALGDMTLIFVVVDRTSGDDANKIILCLAVPSMILQQLQRSFKVCPLYGPPPFTFVKKYSPLQYIFLVFFVGAFHAEPKEVIFQ